MRKLVAGLVMVAGITGLGAGAVSAQSEECPESPQVCPTVTQPPGSVPTTVVQVRPQDEVEVAAGDTLPVTGTDTAMLVGAGVVLAAGGGALVLRSKRAAASSQ